MDNSNETHHSLVLPQRVPRRRGTVRSNSVAQLQTEIQLLTHAPTPQAPLAVPSHWRKESDDGANVPPPCEIVFDSSLRFEDLDWEEEDGLGCCTDDSVPGSIVGLASSTCDSDDGSCRSTSSSCIQQQPHHTVPPISEEQLERQLQIINNNPSPCRVQGICQQWHALCRQDDAFALTLLQHGAMETLLDAMVLQKDFSQVQQAACWVLAELLAIRGDERDAVVEWFGECGGMEAVLRGMALFSDHTGVQQAACAVLRSWTWNHAPSQDLLAESTSGVSAIQTAMKNHPTHAGVQQEGSLLLLNLVDIKAKDTQFQSKTLPLILNAMEAHRDDAAIQEAAGGLLLHLLEQPCNEDSMRADRVVRVLLDRHPSLQDLGNEVLGLLIAPPANHQEYLTPPMMERKSMAIMESPTEVKAIFQLDCPLPPGGGI